ncbi:hypothetical protein [Rhodopila sp.]|uniref:hypothetical protein n=1 Tax=Rhodopila sp. TaxID=2480087 RepID=UPI003D0DB7EF
MRTIAEPEFAQRIRESLSEVSADIGAVTGPGRSGAVAAVYASHILGVPFIPFGQSCPPELGRMLIVDTAIQSGRTLRKAAKKYGDANPHLVAVYAEPPRITFWYEAGVGL